jgi:hypothetical protein
MSNLSAIDIRYLWCSNLCPTFQALVSLIANIALRFWTSRDGITIRGITYAKDRQEIDLHALAVNRCMQPMCRVSGVTTA